MVDYSTAFKACQGNYAKIFAVDEDTGELVELETLLDEKFPWKPRKRKTLSLAAIYDAAGKDYARYAERARYCSTYLEYFAMNDGRRSLKMANFCHLRLCPLCTTRKAKKSAYQLSKILNMVEKDHKDVRFLFLTLTVKNCSGSGLSDTLTLLTGAWHKLMRQRPIQRAVKGWFRAIEITRNKNTGEYHPHIHAILAVESPYFDRNGSLYIKQSEWVARWKKALCVDYDPSVRIQTTKGMKGKGNAAALEAAKYATKDSDYIDDSLMIDEAVDIAITYTEALKHRRLTALSGWLKEAMIALGISEDDDDLVYLDEDEIREDMAELLERYSWSFGGGDYILRQRIAITDD